MTRIAGARRLRRGLIAALTLAATASAALGGATAAAADPGTSGSNTSDSNASGAGAPSADPSVAFTAISTPLPVASAIDRTITFAVTVTAGSRDLTGASVHLQRGNPLINEAQLNAARAKSPATDDVDIPAVPIDATLPAGQRRVITLTVSVDASTDDGAQGLCLSCNPGIYPIDAALTDDSGEEIARAHTYIPYFTSAPTRLQASWMWPLLERPHRSQSRTVFDDDELAASVAEGGRLWRALRVAQLVADKVRLTIMLDPDLIDALHVMSGGYSVRTAAGDVPGTGAAAAAAWLAALAALEPVADLARTAFADPDVDSLSRSGVSWSTVLDSQTEASVRAALGIMPTAAVAWPVDGLLSSQGLDAVVANGASTVLLNDTMFPGGISLTNTPNALAPLPSASGSATAAVLDSGLQPLVATAVAAGTDAAERLTSEQTLYAELAVRVRQASSQAHFAVLAPPRYVDTDPVAAAALMTSLAESPFATDRSLTQAVTGVRTVDHGPLATAAATSAGLAPAQLAILAQARTSVDAFRECLTNDDAAVVLAGYPAAIARAESSYYRSNQAAGVAAASAILASITNLIAQVHITSPNNASYTLASSDAPLFITVENKLPVTVRMTVLVVPAPGERGLVITPLVAQEIPPGIRQLKVAARVERTGRFRVNVTLASPSGQPLGQASQIRVKSTAFGAVALWITGIAFGVLVLALLVRTARQLGRWARRPRGPGAMTSGRPATGGPS